MKARVSFSLLAIAITSAANAQATDPFVFVANDGNLEGSVSSMRVCPDGTTTLVDRVITGSRSSTTQPCAGCNAFAIDLSPDGSHLAVNHASGSNPEQVTIIRVDTNGSLTIVEEFTLAEAGLDIGWVRDDLLAVCITTLSGTNTLRLFQWDANAESLTPTDSDGAGTFLTSITVHPTGDWIYTNDSFGSVVRRFDVAGNSASLGDTTALPVSGVSLEVSPDGRFLYAAGGISAGGNAFAGFSIDPSTGDLTVIPGSPFNSPGSSPKGFAFSSNSAYMYVSHGSDATIQAFAIDPESGMPMFNGESFDVGLQGTLQGMDTIPGFLFALDESDSFDGLEGVYSFAIDAGTGAFPTVAGTPVLTDGISPSAISAWGGAACAADLAEPFGTLNFFDIAEYIALFNAGDPAADLADPAGILNFFDIAEFIALFNAGCP